MMQANLKGNSFSFHIYPGYLLGMSTYLSLKMSEFRGPVEFHAHKLLEITVEAKYVPAPDIFSVNNFTVGRTFILSCRLRLCAIYGLGRHAAINADINSFACAYNLLKIMKKKTLYDCICVGTLALWRACLRIELPGSEPWPGTLCCVS